MEVLLIILASLTLLSTLVILKHLQVTSGTVASQAEEEAKRLLASLTPEEWSQVMAGDYSSIVSKAKRQSQSDSRKSILWEITETEKNMNQLQQSFAHNSRLGYPATADGNKQHLKVFQARIDDLRQRLDNSD